MNSYPTVGLGGKLKAEFELYPGYTSGEYKGVLIKCHRMGSYPTAEQGARLKAESEPLISGHGGQYVLDSNQSWTSPGQASH